MRPLRGPGGCRVFLPLEDLAGFLPPGCQGQPQCLARDGTHGALGPLPSAAARSPGGKPSCSGHTRRTSGSGAVCADAAALGSPEGPATLGAPAGPLPAAPQLMLGEVLPLPEGFPTAATGPACVQGGPRGAGRSLSSHLAAEGLLTRVLSLVPRKVGDPPEAWPHPKPVRDVAPVGTVW